MAEEVLEDRRQEEVWVEEDVLEEQTVNLVAIEPLPVPDVPPTQEASTSSPYYYARLLFARASEPTKLPWLHGVVPLSGDMEPFYDRVLSTEGNIFKACACPGRT